MANTFNIAADLAAMGESLSLVIGGLNREHPLIFAATSVLLQVFVRYRRYAPAMKILTLVLFFYVATAFTVHIPWGEALARQISATLMFSAVRSMMVFDTMSVLLGTGWRGGSFMENETRSSPQIAGDGEPSFRGARNGAGYCSAIPAGAAQTFAAELSLSDWDERGYSRPKQQSHFQQRQR